MKTLDTIITDAEAGYIDFHAFDNEKAFAVMLAAARKLKDDMDCGCGSSAPAPSDGLPNEATRPRRSRFNPLAASSVPIEYRFNKARQCWETRDLGQQYGWVVSDALAEYGPEKPVDARVIIGVRMSRGYPNNRPILIVESAE